MQLRWYFGTTLSGRERCYAFGAARLQSALGAVRGSKDPIMSVSTLPSVDAHAPDLSTLRTHGNNIVTLSFDSWRQRLSWVVQWPGAGCVLRSAAEATRRAYSTVGSARTGSTWAVSREAFSSQEAPALRRGPVGETEGE